MTSTKSLAVELADALYQQAVQAGATTPAVRGADWRLTTVSTVNSDGTVVTADGITARRLMSYQSPAIGDLIVVSQASNGNWMAFGKGDGTGIAPDRQVGAVNISFTTLDSYSGTTVTFPRAFAVTPKVFVNIDSGGAATARWQTRAINVTTTQFVPFCFASTAGATATWSAVPVNWLAVTP